MRFLFFISWLFILNSCGASSSNYGDDGQVSSDATSSVETYQDKITSQQEVSDDPSPVGSAEDLDQILDTEAPLPGNEPEAFAFNGSNYFGSVDSYKFSFVYGGACSSDDYILAGYGAVGYDAGYELDLDGSLHAEAPSYAMYFSEQTSCLIAATTSTGSSFAYWYTWSGANTLEEIVDGAALSTGSMIVTSSYFSSTNIEWEGKYYLSDQSFACAGSGIYLKLEDTADSLDNFMTKSSDWAFGFTSKEDWNLWGGAQQMFVDATTDTNIGNFGLGGYSMLGSFSPHLSISYSGGVSYDSISGFSIADLPMADDSVVFKYTSSNDTLEMFVNGNIVFSMTTAWIPSSADTNRSFHWGKPKVTEGANWGEVYHGAKMPTSWFTKIEDLWISNNAGLDESGILAIAGIISNGGSLIDYADYDTYITHHWSLAQDLQANKGGVDFSRVEE